MRLHCDDNHPDFHPAAYKAKVFLAGSERGSVVFADEEARHAIVYKLNDNGSPIMDLKTGETITEDFWGDVAIVFEDPKVAKQVEDDCKRRDAKIGGYCYKQGKGKKCEQRPYSARCTHCEEIIAGLAEPTIGGGGAVQFATGGVVLGVDMGITADKLAVGTVRFDDVNKPIASCLRCVTPQKCAVWGCVPGTFPSEPIGTSKEAFTVTVNNNGIVGGFGLSQEAKEYIRGEMLASGGIVATVHDEVFVGHSFTGCSAYDSSCSYCLDRRRSIVDAKRVGSGEEWKRARFTPPTNQEIADAYKRGGTAAVVALPGCIKADILRGPTFDQLTVERSWAPKLVMPIMTGGIVNFDKLEQRVLSHSPALSAGYGAATTGRAETPSYETITDVFKALSESIKQCKESMETAIAAAPIRDRVKMSALAAKTVYGGAAVRNVIEAVGGVSKLADIPEDKLPAVLDILDRMHKNVSNFFFDEATPFKKIAERRACGSEKCEWEGETSRYLGTVGPLCPQCGEVTEVTTPPKKSIWLALKEEKGLREQVHYETKRLCDYASRVKDKDNRHVLQFELRGLVRSHVYSAEGVIFSMMGTVAMLAYVPVTALQTLLQKLRERARTAGLPVNE